jgi:hypothetical protein
MGKRLRSAFTFETAFVVLEGDRTESVALTLLDGHGNVNCLARPTLQEWNVSSLVSRVVDLRLGLVHDDFEIAAILVFVANAFRIFFQFGGVVGSGEDVFQEDGVRDADGLASSSWRRATTA